MTTVEAALEVRRAQHGHDDRKDDYLVRLRRIEGQVRGVARMIEADRSCVDVLTQISAVSNALQGVALGLVHDHTRLCLTEAARSGTGEVETRLAEMTAALRRTLRIRGDVT
jgi:CsoR family transcriptional regulator, copper-sensing transcriptional repressor